MDIQKKPDRATLKSYFVKNAIPTAGNFADLIDGLINQKDDGIAKLPGEPLSLQADVSDTGLKKVINFYKNFADPKSAWTLSLNPRVDPAKAETAKPGWSVGDADGNSKLFIDETTGNVGIGTANPGGYKLNVQGQIQVIDQNRDANGGSLLLGAGSQSNLRLGYHADYSWVQSHGGKPLAINPIGNKVGIGTVEPKATLDVNGSALLGYETSLAEVSTPANFGAPIKSGFYQNGGAEITGDVPDAAHTWTHLITARHSNTANNHQLQIAASYANNDKLYFRKIASSGTENPAWNELATRGTNQFAGNQSISGSVEATALRVNGAAVVSNGNNYANKNNYMASGSLTVGGTNVNFGGGTTKWNASTAALLFETATNTEIAVHDAGHRVASLMYYEGDAANRITIGRDMGWGAINQVVFAGAITPSAGNAENTGIMFPKNAFGGGGDAAWLRYYARSGEACTLELGVSNDGNDHIALMSSGNVGIGTNAPSAKLEVTGSVMEQLDLIECKGSGDWTAANHPIMQYFKNKLSGKPVGTYLKAIQDHPSWRGHYWQGWVDADRKIRVIHNYHNTTAVI